MVSFVAFLGVLLTSCSDFLEPVESTSEPSEYSYNYWLLQKTYLFEDDLPLLNPQGDSVSELYSQLSDHFTRYVPPSKSEQTTIQINTSIVQGNVGMEYTLFPGTQHPLVIYRVYPNGPAGKAKVPRYANILTINGVEITGENAYHTYDSVLTYNKKIDLAVSYKGDTLQFNLTKEDVYAPTVFVDTLNGIAIVTITEFKLYTADQVNGTFGELKAYLDSTQSASEPRLLDLRNNPGGHVNQCIAMADLFIKEGTISSRNWFTFSPDGKRLRKSFSAKATPNDPGENEKFVVLVNKNSASCAEIFTAAIAEGAGIPVAGTSTYGKGIGQSTWNTKAKGLAIITNLEFLTPKGNSYHHVGITPDYLCESTASLQCGFDALEKYYGVKSLKKISREPKQDLPILKHKVTDWGGAIMNGQVENF